MAGFLGMRGSGSFAADQRPKNWREMILYLYPNGSAPLTAMLSKMGESSVDDPEFNWWTKDLQTQSGTVNNSYLNADLANALTGSKSAGFVAYCKVKEAEANNIRIGHTVKIFDASAPSDKCVGVVTDVVKNSDNSYFGLKFLEASNANIIDANIDTYQIVGNANPEGGASPDAISYDPVKNYNYTQIFRTPLQISRTAKKTRLRTGDQYKEMKREALELHSIEMEKAFFWGVRSENTGTTGLPERTTGGLDSWITTNRFDYKVDADFTKLGLTAPAGGEEAWVSAGTDGEDFLDHALEICFRHGSNEKLAYCGSGALLGIQKIAKATGNIQLSPTTTEYGIKVVEWITPFGVVHLKTHPLLSYDVGTRNSMFVIEPDKLKYRYIDDTDFIDSTPAGQDGIKEEFLTECGLEIHHEKCHMRLDNVGNSH